MDFMKLEYEAVMRKMSEIRADLGRTETIYPVAMAVIYAWLFTHGTGGGRAWAAALLLPPVIGALGLLRIWARQQTMALLEDYCCRLESLFYGDAAPGGWEHVYAATRPMRLFALVRLCVSIFILGASLLLSVWALHDPSAFAPAVSAPAQPASLVAPVSR
jgi:hypothetical protein